MQFICISLNLANVHLIILKLCVRMDVEHDDGVCTE